jgi:hypothetical protein
VYIKKGYIVTGIIVTVIMIACSMYQKMTSWEDRFGQNGIYTCTQVRDQWFLVSSDESKRRLFVGPGSPRLSWNGVRLVSNSKGTGGDVKTRDWLYIPPYFRWFLGRK